MKIKLLKAQKRAHKDMGTSICLNGQNNFYTTGEDKTVYKWDIDGQCGGQVCELDSPITCIDWFPSLGGAISDAFVLSCADGTFRIMNRSGREEKKIEAHKGSIVKIKYSYDGSSIITCGEDGTVKSWSSTGVSRSTISCTPNPVYSISWGPNNQIVFCSGKDIIIRALENAKKQMKWKGHDNVILCVDWNIINNKIISGGEDCRYKIWDEYGRLLYCSIIIDNVITAISWMKSGDIFIVGCFNYIRICDRTGICLCRELFSEGSPYDISWSIDTTQIGICTGSGNLVLGYLTGNYCSWKTISAELKDPRLITILDSKNGNKEDIDFRDRVVHMNMKFDHLIVITNTQCYIYNIPNWTSPHIFDIKNSVFLLIPSQRHFIIIDNVVGIQNISYDGKTLSSPKIPSLKPELLSSKTLSVTSDILAIIDQKDNKTISYYDVSSGKTIGKPFVHTHQLEEISLSLHVNDRMIAFIDSNRDLFLTDISTSLSYKLLSLVDSITWSEDCDMLIALSDRKIYTYFHAKTITIDKDLFHIAVEIKEDLNIGQHSEIYSLYSTQLAIRTQKGTIINTNVSPYPSVLYNLILQNKWDNALRLCRFVKSKALWATLAAISLGKGDLEKAEQSLANIGEVAKQQYLLYLMELPNDVCKQSGLALYQHKPDLAENILLQATPPLIYRAIKLNIRLFRWKRAIKIAKDNNQHIDTVLYYRSKYLQQLNLQEKDNEFIELNKKFPFDEATVIKNKEKSREEEQRAGKLIQKVK